MKKPTVKKTMMPRKRPVVERTTKKFTTTHTSEFLVEYRRLDSHPLIDSHPSIEVRGQSGDPTLTLTVFDGGANRHAVEMTAEDLETLVAKVLVAQQAAGVTER